MYSGCTTDASLFLMFVRSNNIYWTREIKLHEVEAPLTLWCSAAVFKGLSMVLLQDFLSYSARWEV